MSKKSEQGYSVDCYMNKVVNVVLNAKCYMGCEGNVEVEVDVGSGVLVVDESEQGHLSRELCLLIKSLYKHLPQFV